MAVQVRGLGRQGEGLRRVERGGKRGKRQCCFEDRGMVVGEWSSLFDRTGRRRVVRDALE